MSLIIHLTLVPKPSESDVFMDATYLANLSTCGQESLSGGVELQNRLHLSPVGHLYNWLEF